jgi:hypothetical protein
LRCVISLTENPLLGAHFDLVQEFEQQAIDLLWLFVGKGVAGAVDDVHTGVASCRRRARPGSTTNPSQFNLQGRAVRHPSQYSYAVCDDIGLVALLLSMVVRKLRGTR